MPGSVDSVECATELGWFQGQSRIVGLQRVQIVAERVLKYHWCWQLRGEARTKSELGRDYDVIG